MSIYYGGISNLGKTTEGREYLELCGKYHPKLKLFH
jgi:hypothetical protein